MWTDGPPQWLSGKVPTHNAGDAGSIKPWVGKIPGGGSGSPLQCSCLRSPIGKRALAGYSPGGLRRVKHSSATKQQCDAVRRACVWRQTA